MGRKKLSRHWMIKSCGKRWEEGREEELRMLIDWTLVHEK